MARTMRWARANWEWVDNFADSNSHFVQGPQINVGETLTRIRTRWYATHFPTSAFAFEATQFSIVFAIIVLPATSTAADVPDAFDTPNADWVWYGSTFFTPLLGANTDGTVQQLGAAPLDPNQEVDVKAQRAATTEAQTVWFTTATSTLAPTQTTHGLSLTYSVGILEVP